MKLFDFYRELNVQEQGDFRYLLTEVLDPQTSDGPAFNLPSSATVWSMLKLCSNNELVVLLVQIVNHSSENAEDELTHMNKFLNDANATIQDLRTENGVLKAKIAKLEKRIETGNKLLKRGPAPSKDQIKDLLRKSGVITDQTEQITCPECGSKRWGAYTSCPNWGCPSNKRYHMTYKPQLPPQVGNGIHELPSIMAFTVMECQDGE